MKCDSPYIVSTASRGRVPVPCGRCPNCKKRLVASWAFRLEQEDRVSALSLFLTLTYDTRTVPITENGFMTLEKSDLQKFMKRLRKNTGKQFSYMAVGEYGSKNKRPHYHMILFCKSDEVTEDEILRDWQHGAIHVGRVSGASIRYTMKYIDKPGRIPQHKRDDRQKEFRLMSKGLGLSYLSPAVVQHHQNNPDKLYVNSGQHKVAMPKYYRHRLWTPEELEQQSELIEQNIIMEEAKAKQKWEAENPGKDWEAYQNQQRLGRYHNFYKSLKSRK